MDFHEFAWEYEWDTYKLLHRIAREYPDVMFILCHGSYSIGDYTFGSDRIKQACNLLTWHNNIVMETGTWPAEYCEIAIKDPNVGVTQLIFGTDYGHVPQYIMMNPTGDPRTFSSSMKRFPPVPHYQVDWWGWSLYQIDKIRDYVTQDEINLILGGNAARIWRLPVPYERMFLSGRPDVFGINWQQSVPYIPREQVIHPDYED